MTAVVVDASVVLKWFIEESLVDEAESILKTFDSLYAPGLVVAEVTNAIWKKCLRGEITRAQADSIAEEMLLSPLLYVPESILCQRALEIALTLRHPVYDCLYLACAESLEAELVTADSRFHAAVRNSDFAGRVIHLSALPDAPP